MRLIFEEFEFPLGDGEDGYKLALKYKCINYMYKEIKLEWKLCKKFLQSFRFLDRFFKYRSKI